MITFENKDNDASYYKTIVSVNGVHTEAWELKPLTPEDDGYINDVANKWLSEMERVRQARDSQYINSDRLLSKHDNLLLDGDTEEAQKALEERIALKNAIKADNPYPEKPEVLVDQTELLTVLLEQYPNLNHSRILTNG